MENKIISYQNEDEKSNYDKLLNMLLNSKIDKKELLTNLGSFLTSKTLSRILVMEEMYKQIIGTPGVVMDFGCNWGQIGILFSHFRSMYEPFNRHRKIIAFDTFEGFPDIQPQDGTSDMMTQGNLSTGTDYIEYLDQLYQIHENLNPMNWVKKYEIVQGDVCKTVKKYLETHPETIIALAYFDLDLYVPTKKVLEIIKPHVTKGSILGFDELIDTDSPGETLALKEVFPVNTISLKRRPTASRTTYFKIEG